MNLSEFPLLLILESILPFLILSIILILVILAGRKKFKQAAKLLILSVKSSEDKEKQIIIKFLTEKLSFEEKVAKKKAKKILNERKFLIRNLVSGLLDKNIEALSELNQDLSRITDHYHGLELKVTAVEDEVVEEVIDEEENEKEVDLKKEIKGLKKEVHITLTTLNNIFKEFSSMFGEDDTPEGQMTVDQIITAMESFSNKSVDTANDKEDPEVMVAAADESENTDKGETSTITDPETQKLSEPPEQSTTEPKDDIEESINDQLNEAFDEPEEAKIEASQQSESEELDFSVDSAIDDIDSALDELELDASDDEEPDWGDAFAESGDVMDDDEVK